MLAVGDVESIAHHFEDELGAARRGHLVMSAAIVDRLYRGLDAMRRLVREAVGGEAAQVDIPQVLAQLRGEVLPDALAPEAGLPASVVVAPASDGVNSTVEERSHTEHRGANDSVPDGDVPETTIASGSLRWPATLAIEDASPPEETGRNGATPPPEVMPPPATQAPSIELTVAEDEPPAAMRESPIAVDESPASVSPSAFKIETVRVEPQSWMR
jgi:chemotaxis protein histidine kinase CheA